MDGFYGFKAVRMAFDGRVVSLVRHVARFTTSGSGKSSSFAASLAGRFYRRGGDAGVVDEAGRGGAARGGAGAGGECVFRDFDGGGGVDFGRARRLSRAGAGPASLGGGDLRGAGRAGVVAARKARRHGRAARDGTGLGGHGGGGASGRDAHARGRVVRLVEAGGPCRCRGKSDTSGRGGASVAGQILRGVSRGEEAEGAAAAGYARGGV